MKTLNLTKAMLKDYSRDKTSLFYIVLFNPILYILTLIISRAMGHESFAQTAFHAFLLMSLLSITLFNFPILFADLIERGVNKKLYTTPINLIQYFMALLLSQLFMILASMVPLYALGLGFGADISTSPFQVFILLISGLTLISISLAIVSYVREIAALKSVSNLFYLYFILLGGLFFSTGHMLKVFTLLAQANPIHHFMVMMNLTNSLNLSLSNILVPMLWMIVALIVFAINFKKVMSYE